MKTISNVKKNEFCKVRPSKTGMIFHRKLEILVILTYLKEKLKYCLKKCLFISVGVIEN